MLALKPKHRSPIRIILGKIFFRIKRYLEWFTGKQKFALEHHSTLMEHKVFSHKSMLLRELKDVEMWLQHNKVKNLKIATKKLNRIVIKPGETFSYWRLLGNTTKRNINANLIMYSNDRLNMYSFDNKLHNIPEVECYVYEN